MFRVIVDEVAQVPKIFEISFADGLSLDSLESLIDTDSVGGLSIFYNAADDDIVYLAVVDVRQNVTALLMSDDELAEKSYVSFLPLILLFSSSSKSYPSSIPALCNIL